MSVKLKFVLALAGLFAYVLAGLAALWAAIASDLRPDDRSVFERVLRDEAGLAVFLGLLFLLGLGLVVGIFFRLYVLSPARLARETRLIATANPGHRIEAGGPAELSRVVEAVNELADRSQTAQEDVGGQIASARADVEQERNRLAALMSELTLAVLVCSVEGRILLYNDAARQLLGGKERAGGLVGLGRSVFGILDRGLVAHAFERLGHGAEGDGAAPAVHLTATAAGGQLVRVGAAPVLDRDDEITGLVLTLEDVSRRAESGARRDALLRSLTEGTRASVGTIRAAVESMVDYPEMDSADRERFTAIIRDEAVGLSDQVEEAQRESAGYLRSQWRLADMLGRDLLAALQRSLESELGVEASAEDAGVDLWLKVDSYALVQGVAYLASRLRDDAGIARFSLHLREAGRHARLDLSWAGEQLDEETLRAWAGKPLQRDGGGISATLRDVVERHGGELWCQGDAAARTAYVRLLLPIADTVPAARPEPRPSRAPAESRPEFYDFDLFRPAEHGAEWDERSLEELAYTVFDTETTGLNPSVDEVVAFGAVRIVNGRLLRQETLDQLVDPRRPISAASVSVHGISAELVQGEPTIEEVLPTFARFCEDTVLVGHNVAFDMRFLELKEELTGVRLTQPVLDTLLLSAVVEPEHEDHSLEAMAARLGVSVIGRHTALGDAILTGEVFLKQVRLLAAQGVVTLGDAREAARRTYLARVSDSLYLRA